MAPHYFEIGNNRTCNISRTISNHCQVPHKSSDILPHYSKHPRFDPYLQLTLKKKIFVRITIYHQTMGIKPPIQHHIQRNPDAMSVKGSWRTNDTCRKNNSCNKSIKCVKQVTTKMKMLHF